MIVVTLASLLLAGGVAGPIDAYDGMSRVDATRVIAVCVMKRDRTGAMAVAQTDPATPNFKKAAARINPALATCLKAQATSLTVRVNDMRGVLAEGFLREGEGASLVRARALSPTTPKRVTFGKSEALNDATLFRCVVDAAPAQAATMVLAQPGSVDEGAAFREMAPALQACVPENAEVHLKPFQIRLLVAASLYSRLVALPGA